MLQSQMPSQRTRVWILRMHAAASAAPWMTGSVTISSRGVPARLRVDAGPAAETLVHRAAGVLLEMGPDEADVAAGAAGRLDGDRPPGRDRVLVLADLVALG